MWLWCEVLTTRCGVCVVVVVLKALAVADTLVLLIIFLLRSFRYVAPLVSRRPGPRHQEVPHTASVPVTGTWCGGRSPHTASVPVTGAWRGAAWCRVVVSRTPVGPPTHRVSTGAW